jgi:NADH-quinone oxidoreductase subunit A
MENLLVEYLPILIFLGLALGLAIIIPIASLIVVPQKPDTEKLSAYECGFEPFEDARIKFDVRFYLVAILFIIFDLEVVIFLSILTIGFIYEWRKGALEWE